MFKFFKGSLVLSFAFITLFCSPVNACNFKMSKSNLKEMETLFKDRKWATGYIVIELDENGNIFEEKLKITALFDGKSGIKRTIKEVKQKKSFKGKSASLHLILNWMNSLKKYPSDKVAAVQITFDDWKKIKTDPTQAIADLVVVDEKEFNSLAKPIMSSLNKEDKEWFMEAYGDVDRQQAMF